MRHGLLSKMDKGRRREGGWFLPPVSWLVLCPSTLLIPSHSGPDKPHMSLALGRIDLMPERGREGVSEVGESRDQEKPEVSLVGWGMEVQRVLPTLALGVAPRHWGAFRESELWIGLIKAGPGNCWGELIGWLSQGTAGCLWEGR